MPKEPEAAPERDAALRAVNQLDLFAALPGDLPTHDQQEMMERPFFSLSKGKRIGACCEIAGVWVIDEWEKCGMRREAALCGSVHPFRGSFCGFFHATDRVPV